MNALPGGPPVAATASRRRTLRWKLARTGVIVSFVSVLLLAAFNFVEASSLLRNGVEAQLSSQAAARAETIRTGVRWIGDTVAVGAKDARIAAALVEFSDAFAELDQEPQLDAGELAQLEQLYADSVVTPLEGLGVSWPPIEELLPASQAGRYLQYHYVVNNPNDPDQRIRLTTADEDTSEYGRVHALRHPGLSTLPESYGFGDVLLVDRQGNVVYSTDKRLDFGSSIDGPLTRDALGDILARLAAAPADVTVLSDVQLYGPTGGSPKVFAASAVRSNAETVGALLVEVPIAALNRLTTADGQWEEAGLGSTGEVYVVGSDGLLRSESRRWIEDSDQYVSSLEAEGFPEELGDAMQQLGSAIKLQPVDTKPVEVALGGEVFTGWATDYLGRESLAVARPLALDELDWVVVAEVSRDEASESVRSFVWRIAITLALLLPAALIASLLLARRMTQPVDPVLAGAAAIASGDVATRLPDLGRNEFGDVAQRMNLLAQEIRRQERELDEQEAELTRLLLAALPARLVEQVRNGERRLDDLADTATIIAVTVDGLLGQPDVDAASGVELGARLSRDLEALAGARGIERVRSSSEHHLFAAGLGVTRTEAAASAAFALEAAAAIDRLGHQSGSAITYRMGLAAGQVISGLLSGESLTYGVFGEPVQRALTLAASASDGQILVHSSVASELDAEWDRERLPQLLGLRGEPLDAVSLLSGPRSNLASPDVDAAGTDQL